MELSEKICGEIRNRGMISFARFMELALYCPVYGYYEKERDTIGQRGDYYTSVSTGPLFGELLGAQFTEWLLAQDRSGEERERQIIEAGAHRGDLARDILCWIRRHRPEVFQNLEYWIVEPSERRQRWQEETLHDFKGKVRWMGSLEAVRSATKSEDSEDLNKDLGVEGIIFGNELLDAMPVHRFGWDAEKRVWFEWGVSLENGCLGWARMPLQGDDSGGETRQSNPFNFSLPTELTELLPDGFTVDISPAATQWWRTAANLLSSGRLVAVDYGLTTEDFLAPERKNGTLRAYYQHRASADVFANLGEQDLTAHVNFTALLEAGESERLKTDFFGTQAAFLTRIAAAILEGRLGFGEWTGERARQFTTLTHPEFLGRAFKVLVQSTQ